MLKKITLLLITVVFIQAGKLDAAPMAVHNAQGDWYDVTADNYRCTFYNGCMYPVWFTSADGSWEFPRGFLLDWVKKSDAPDTELHYLRNDHFAEVAIIENTDSCLVVECTGRFCKGIYIYPGVVARYRWTLQRNSPEILLQGEIYFAAGSTRQLTLTNLGSMAFRNMPFEQVQLGSSAPQKFRTAGQKPQAFTASDGVMLIAENNLAIGISSPAVAWNNSFNRYYTYVSRNVPVDKRLWNGLEPLKFEVKFKVQGRAVSGRN